MRHFKRNFALTALNGVFFNSAAAFLSETTVLPFFVSSLTKSRILVGLAGSLERASWPLPQVIVAPFAERSERKMPLYVNTAFIRFFSLLALSLLTFALGTMGNHLFLWLFFSAFAIYSLSGGVAGPAFLDIVAKTIPSNRRGSLWAVRISFGYLLAAAGGFAVKYMLKAFPFPANYGAIFLASTGLVTVGLLSFSFVVEPVQPVQGQRKTLTQHVAEGKRCFGEDPNFRGLVAVRLLLGILSMATPFYVVYGRELGVIEESAVGPLLVAQMLGLALSNIVWGSLANRLGSRLVLIGTALSGTIPPLGVLVTPLLSTGLPYFTALFFLMGVSDAGLHLGYSTFLLDIAPPLKRMTYIGFINTAIAPVLFLPTLGGTIVDLISYQALFALAALGGGFSIYRSFMLREVRKPGL